MEDNIKRNRIMGITKETKMKLIPWLLIFGGFYSLIMMPAVIAGGCIVVGITMLIERRWPEKWGASSNSINQNPNTLGNSYYK